MDVLPSNKSAMTFTVYIYYTVKLAMTPNDMVS